MLGPYAEGNDGTEEVVFAAFMGENHAGLTPLERFGFVLHPGKMSACHGAYSGQPVECPPEGEPSIPPMQPPVALPAPTITNSVPAPNAVPPPSNNGRQIPPDADPQGFVGYPGARCNSTNPAVAIARTAQSAVVICETGVGRFYNKGSASRMVSRSRSTTRCRREPCSAWLAAARRPLRRMCGRSSVAAAVTEAGLMRPRPSRSPDTHPACSARRATLSG